MQQDLFPEIEPFHTFRLKAGDIHEIYVEECGNPGGQPVIFLHGGPGGGCTEKHRRYFDPSHYRIILFDQRGSGRSTPHAELRENTTPHLVEDMERIREKLGIQKWLVFGGSWGSTLGLAYAISHPQAVSALVLRGIYLCRKAEVLWFYQDGCQWIFPDVKEAYESLIPPDERHDMINAYYRRLTSTDPEIRTKAAAAWSRYEGSTLKLIPDLSLIEEFGEPERAVALARIECHYFVHNTFFPSDNYLLENVHRIRNIPAVLVHGRYDVVCPVKNAWDLKKAWPEADLKIIPDAGHAADEPGLLRALMEATEHFKN